jgi:predicted DNA-binding WGR domain protein
MRKSQSLGMESEFWEVSNVDKNYLVSNFGRVKSLRTNKILKQTTDRNGYLHVCLCTNNKRKNMMVHRLVALSYLPNPEDKPEVNHIDGNKENNRIDNLEWATSKENIDHAYKIGLRNNDTIINNGKRNSRKVYQLDINDNSTIRIWESASQVERELGFDRNGIIRCCKLINDTIGGFRWRYEETLNIKRERKSTANPSRQVILIDVRTDGIIKIFNSAEELANYLGVTRNAVYRVINGDRKTLKGYGVKYL